MKYLYLLFFNFIFLAEVFSQNISFDFKQLTIENGLSSNGVTSIIQDRKGFLWIGTEDGLNRFDGYSFKKYLNKRGNKNTLSHNYVWSLAEDKEGFIWIATNGGGLNKFDPVQEKFYHYRNNPDDSLSLSSDLVQCVYIDKQDNLWIGTWGEGLNLFVPEKNSFIRFKHDPQNSASISGNKIWCVYEDSKNNLWVGIDGGGLNLFDKKNKTFTRFLPGPNSLSGFSIVTIKEDSKGNLWLGTYGDGLDIYNYKTKTFTNYRADGRQGSISGNFIWNIIEDKQGLIWIATQSNGVNIYDYESKTFRPVILNPESQDDVSANNSRIIFEDNSSNLWIGTIVGGLFKTDLKPDKFSTLKKIPGNNNSLPEDFIFTLCEDNEGNIWIGTYSGLAKYFPATGRIKTYPVNTGTKNSVKGEIVRYIYKDTQGDIWVGTYFGQLNKYDPAIDSFIKYNLDFSNGNPGLNNIRVIFEDKDSILWFGSNGDGLIRYNRKTNEYKFFNTKNSGISGDGVLSIVEDHEGCIWIGTFSSGLNKFDKINNSFLHFFSNENDTSSISDNSVTELFMDSKGVLWVGTFSGGLCRYDREKNLFKSYKEEDGLSGNFIAGILEDDNNNLWISTSKGISKFNPEKESIKNYDFTFRLQRREFNPAARLKAGNGIFYFGGSKGLNYFHPDSIKENTLFFPVVITSFKVHNNDVQLEKNISFIDTIFLNYDEDFFSFEFASLDFTSPEKNIYTYILEGFDKEWNYSGNRRFASYTHLDPGSYTFRVRGTNSEGTWSEQEATLLIFIKPPFWETWWFRISLFILLVLALGFIYKRRVSNLEKEKKAQEEFSRRLIQSQEEERKRIASELHDSLGQNLLIIKNRALLGLKNSSQDFTQEQLNEISASAASAIEEVRQIAYNLHPYQLDRLGLTKAVKSIINQTENLTKIKFDEAIENIDNIFSKENEINFYRIIQEIINNIIKHAEADKAEIIISREKSYINIIISDNGKGFITDGILTEGKGFGMKSISKRVNILKGEFIIDSRPGKGTITKIKIPYE